MNLFQWFTSRFQQRNEEPAPFPECDEDVPPEVLEELLFKTVWCSDWCTDAGIECQALVARSPEGYHARVSYAENGRDWSSDWRVPHATKEEAIASAKNEMYSWLDSRGEILMEHEDAEIEAYCKRMEKKGG